MPGTQSAVASLTAAQGDKQGGISSEHPQPGHPRRSPRTPRSGDSADSLPVVGAILSRCALYRPAAREWYFSSICTRHRPLGCERPQQPHADGRAACLRRRTSTYLGLLPTPALAREERLRVVVSASNHSLQLVFRPAIQLARPVGACRRATAGRRVNTKGWAAGNVAAGGAARARTA